MLSAICAMYQDTVDLQSDQQRVFSLAVSSGLTSDGMTGYTSQNAFISLFKGNSSGMVPWDVIAHEIAHLTQYREGILKTSSAGNENTKTKEFAAYQKSYIAEYGENYFANKSYYDNEIKNILNTAPQYSGLSWSTGTASGESTFDPNYSPIGTTGLLSSAMDQNGDWIENFYYYDNTEPNFDFEWYDGPVVDPDGWVGFSTGFKNMTTNEIFFAGGGNYVEEAYLYTSTGGSTGSTGDSTGTGG